MIMELEVDYVLKYLKIQDEHLFEDLLHFRSHDAHRLLKRLDAIHKSLADLDKRGRLEYIDKDNTENFLRHVIHRYWGCIESVKLARSVEKLLHPWKSTYQKFIEHELQGLVWSVVSKDNSDISSLTAVCNLLDENVVVRDSVVDRLVPFLTWLRRQLGTLVTQSPSGLSTVEAGKLYASVKIVLQLFQSCPRETSIRDQVHRPPDCEQYDCLEDILTDVYAILDKEGYTTDCVQLAGTTFSFVLCSTSSPARSVSAFWSTFLPLSTQGRFSVADLQTTGQVPCKLPSPDWRQSLGPLCLAKGFVACSSADILCYRGDSQPNAFITDLFHVIYGYCSGSIRLRFHSFSLLLSWYKKFSICLSHSDIFKVKCLSTREHFSQTLSLVFLNWDSPVEDVAEIIGAIFRVLLECWSNVLIKSKESLKSAQNDLPIEVLTRLQNTPWYVKGKYRILAILISYLDQEKMLSSSSEIKLHLRLCMSTNYLAPSGADVYKAFLQHIAKRYKTEEVVETWRDVWLETVTKGLSSDNVLLRSNVNHYWIQSTLKVLPPVGDFLQEHLSELLHGNTSRLPRQHVLHAWVVVSKVIRNNTGKEAQDTDLLREALYSSVDDTRADAIGLVCSSLRKAESLSERDSALLMEVLPCNLKIDSAPFRQHLGASMRKLLARLRDSCLAGLRTKDDTVLLPSLAFVEWLQRLCVDNLMAGASYQRRKTCLDLLSILYDTLVYQEDSRQRKSFTPEATLTLVAYARERGVWDFFSVHNTVCVLHCLRDGADEIQEMSASLLLKCFNWPLCPDSSMTHTTQEDVACHLVSRAVMLCNSPKATESESGALLLKVIFTKYVVEQGWNFNMTLTTDGAMCTVVEGDTPADGILCTVLARDAPADGAMCAVVAGDTPANGAICAVVPGDTPADGAMCAVVAGDTPADGAMCAVVAGDTPSHKHPAVTFLDTLISFIVNTIKTSKINVVLASKTSPIHGLVTACTRCIAETPDLVSKHTCDIDYVVKEMISLDMDIIDTMLKVMARDSKNEQCPSFAEISMALENWISESREEYCESTSLSANYQYLLSWCWINIKESCISLGNLADVLIQSGKGTDISIIQSMSQVFLNVLTNCRHKGVIEGCRAAFVKFCFSLFSTNNAELNQLPEHILKESLSTMVAKATSTSTTRMSAGLPIVIQTIVSCERKYKKNKLLQTALDSLYHITCLPLGGYLDDKFDLPQVHGLNILNSLFTDSSLTASLMPHVGATVKLVVESFGSPAWAIRNAATRLFSSLVTKIFGHKKSTEECACNTLSFQEFASHYPELPPFMLDHLDLALQTDIEAIDKLHPSLFPMLTLLSNLGPTENVQQEHGLIPKFQDRIQCLLASPVYYLRHLTASACVAMVTVQSVREYLIGLLKDIPECICESHFYNRLHGILLCLEKTLNNHKLREVDEMMEELMKRSWVFTDLGVCPVISNAYLNVLAKLLPDCSGRLKAVGLGMLIGVWESVKQQPREDVRLGGGEFIKNLVRCLLVMRDPDEDTVTLCVGGLLVESDMDTKLACTSTLAGLLESWPGTYWGAVQETVVDMLTRESYPPLLTDCLSLLVNVHQTHGTQPRIADRFHQHCCNHGNSGQGSVDAGLLAVAAIGIKHCIDTSGHLLPQVLYDWCQRVWQASCMAGDEHFRLAAAQAMLIAGHVVMTSYGISGDVTLQKCVVRLFQAAVNLIQDEDDQVRCLAVKFVSLLSYPGRSIQFDCVQYNSGYQLLFEFLPRMYWWSGVMVSALVQMLYTPGSVRTCLQHKITPSNQYLFEQEDDHFCTESLFNRIEVCKALKCVSRACSVHQVYTSIQCLRETPSQLCDDLTFIEDFLKHHVNGRPVFSLCVDTAVLSAIGGGVLLGLVLVEDDSSTPDVDTRLQTILMNPNLPPAFRRTMDELKQNVLELNSENITQNFLRPTWV